MDRIKYFKYYSLAKSTALVIAIFPLFLHNQLGLSEADIIYISSYCFLLPLILEIFLGIFADYFGSVSLVKFGMIVFTLAYISLLLLSKYQAYYIYIFGITLAAACFSGAEDSLLLAILPDNYELFAIKADLASFIYQNTIILLLFGGILYYFAPYSPIFLQILSLAMGYIFLTKATVNLAVQKNKAFANPICSVLACKKELLDLYKLSLIVLIATSSFVVLLNNRIVSIHFANILNFNPAIVISIIFVMGNLISAKANLWFKQYFKKFATPLIPVTIIGLLAIISFLSMASSFFIGLMFGFLILAVFKASYRAYLSTALISSINSSNYIATILSACSLLTAIIYFALSLLYAHFFVNFHLANLYIAELLTVIFAFALGFLYKQRCELKYITHPHAFSGKKHFIKRYYQNFTYGQEYPSPADINKNLKNASYINCLYPAPAMVKISDNVIEWEYVKGKNLSQLDTNGQLAVLDALCAIFKTRLANNITLAHGDLHPDNIMVKNNGSFVAIDWDLCQPMPPYFDVMTLLTHPELKIKLDKRLNLLAELLDSSLENTQEAAHSFIQEKIARLSAIKNANINTVLEKYKELEREINLAG